MGVSCCSTVATSTVAGGGGGAAVVLPQPIADRIKVPKLTKWKILKFSDVLIDMCHLRPGNTVCEETCIPSTMLIQHLAIDSLNVAKDSIADHWALTWLKRRGTVLCRSSFWRKPLQPSRGNRFQSSDGRRRAQQSLVCPRNRRARLRPILEYPCCQKSAGPA